MTMHDKESLMLIHISTSSLGACGHCFLLSTSFGHMNEASSLPFCMLGFFLLWNCAKDLSTLLCSFANLT